VVERGLKAGELLIVEGISKVKPGMVVKPVPAGQKQAAPTGSPAQPAKAGG
jgi:membrane fusion protein (multidrug efflux system)